MIGQTLGHYRILQELGSGGMGTVYLAEDTKLGRKIALKILPEETARDPERRARFEREARAVASLNHPNIVVIHSVEEDRGIPFITMEHVSGRRLSSFIPEDGMRLRDFFELAIPLADAIFGAHRQGITHRDLKPDNVMVNDEGRVKVLDFGLAKLFESLSSNPEATMTVGDMATREGKILGTAAYMSPEQAEGKPVDHRTDIFSLGVVLYEMATGRRPFVGDSQMSTLTAVIRDTPPGVNEVKPDLPRHLGRIVSRCLAKSPDRRPQTALDVKNELEALKEEIDSESGTRSAASSIGVAARTAPAEPTPYPQATGSAPPAPTPYPATSAAGMMTAARRRLSPVATAFAVVAVIAIAVAGFFALRGKGNGDETRGPAAGDAQKTHGAMTIVVLPFENLGPPEDAYFAAGITDEITSRLANVSGLTVLSRTTATQYDKTGKTMPEIGKDLGVAYVLEGTVRWEKLGNGASRVRVIPQLIRTADDSPFWSERYEESMEAIFHIQSTIAERVVEALGVTLLEPARLALATKLTDNVDAYHAYLKALDYTEGIRFDEPSCRLAVDLLTRATELDPEFLVAFAMLAKAHAGLVHFGFEATPERLAAAEAAVKRVEKLGPGSPWVAYAKGWTDYWGKKALEPALAELERARKDLPGNADILEAIGFIRRRQGRYEEALASLHEAAERDPRNSRLLFGIAETNCLLDRFEKALPIARQVISLSPDTPQGYDVVAWASTALGSFDDARQVLAQMPQSPDAETASARQDRIYQIEFFEGRKAEALAAAAGLPDLLVIQFSVLSKSLYSGLAEALLGNRDAARAHFEEALSILEPAVEKKPDDSRLRSALGMAHAGLGHREAALREGKKALEVYPATHDVWIRSVQEVRFGYTLMLLDDLDGAAAHWKKMIDEPGDSLPSRTLLRISPVFESLRNQPEFQKLVAAET